jgi:hypothetical protein
MKLMFVINNSNNNNTCSANIIWPYQIILALDIRTGKNQTLSVISMNYCM